MSESPVIPALKGMLEAPELLFKWATGILVLSITFRGSLVGQHPICLWMLSVAWIAFAITCLSYLFFKLLTVTFNLVEIMMELKRVTFKERTELFDKIRNNIMANKNLSDSEKADKTMNALNQYLIDVKQLQSIETKVDFPKLIKYVPICFILEMTGFFIGVIFIILFAVFNNQSIVS